MSIYNVVNTGSAGNCVLYHDNSIMIDCGVSFKSIKPFLNSIQAVLLTHEHKDHINIATLRKLQFEKPALRVMCGEFMVKHLSGIRNIDVVESGRVYDYGVFEISPITLYHDVPNYGYRIFKDGHKLIHCTDTYTLEGVEAIGYDLYSIEANYNEDDHIDRINEKREKGQFAYESGAMNSHLSTDQAWNFINDNKKDSSEILKLHMSSSL